jgi:hypothetical protein
VLHLSQRTKRNKLTVTLTAENGQNTAFEGKTVTLVVHGVKKSPKKCTQRNAQIIDRQHDSSRKTMQITIKTTNKIENIQMKW